MNMHREYELAVLFQDHMVNRGYAANTIEQYLRAVRFLWSYFDEIGRCPAAREISAQDIREFVIYRLRTHRGSTVAVNTGALRLFFAYLESSGVIDRSPARNISLPITHKKPTPIVLESELKRILGACAGVGFLDLRDMAIIRVFMATGARRSELIGLRIDPDCYSSGDLGLKEGIVKLRDVAGVTRRCALDPRTVRSLRRYLQARSRHRKKGLPNLWLTHKGGLTPTGLQSLVKNRAEKAGVRGFSSRRVRATFAHRWLQQGGNPGDLMRVLGLRNRKMIDRYVEGVAGQHSVTVARKHFGGYGV